MRARVTEQGVLIPKELLPGVEEVEIQQRNGVLIVVPVTDADPLYTLGSAPVHLDVTDASVRHDKYIYAALKAIGE